MQHQLYQAIQHFESLGWMGFCKGCHTKTAFTVWTGSEDMHMCKKCQYRMSKTASSHAAAANIVEEKNDSALDSPSLTAHSVLSETQSEANNVSPSAPSTSYATTPSSECLSEPSKKRRKL